MNKSEDNRYVVRANWDPMKRAFKHLTHLNEETSKGTREHISALPHLISLVEKRCLPFIDRFADCVRIISGARVFFTVALDVVISGIHEPVRFLIEGKARVCQPNQSDDGSSQDPSESIWASFKKVTPFFEDFDLLLKQVKKRRNARACRDISLV